MSRVPLVGSLLAALFLTLSPGTPLPLTPAPRTESNASRALAFESAHPGALVGAPVAGAQEPIRTRFRRGGQPVVPRRPLHIPILMYHYIRVNPDPTDRLGFNLSVPPSDFAAQLDYLADRGYRGVGLDELAGYLSGVVDEPPPSRSVVLTFDDGYRDFYEAAFPLLKRHGFRATVFMIAGLVDQPRYLTAAQLRELSGNGISIGAHTVNHPDLTAVAPSTAEREIASSKATLEQMVGRNVDLFSYPSGRYNSAVVSLVRKAGYKAAVTTERGAVHGPEDRLQLSRIRVSGGESAAALGADAGLNVPPPPAYYFYPLRPFGGPSPD